MKYAMLAVVATIGAVALLTIAGAFLSAISEELEDMRDLLIAYADAIRVDAQDEFRGRKPPHIFEPWSPGIDDCTDAGLPVGFHLSAQVHSVLLELEPPLMKNGPTPSETGSGR